MRPAWRHRIEPMRYRFNKMQATMGEGVVPATSTWLREPHEDWPIRDTLAYEGVLTKLRPAALVAAMDAARCMVQAYKPW